jgi:Chitin binding Peritrophin-A domain
MSCPQNWVYNAGLKGCQPRTQARDCVQANCGGQANNFVPYPADSSLYVFCGGGANNALLQCPTGETFDPLLRSCGAQICTAEGLLSYPGDASKYYVCVSDGNGGVSHK